jgi:hypothetical protein
MPIMTVSKSAAEAMPTRSKSNRDPMNRYFLLSSHAISPPYISELDKRYIKIMKI